MESINPTTGERWRVYPETSEAELREAPLAAHQAFLLWRARTFAERAAVLRNVATLLRKRRDEFARLMALEMGKPIAQGRAEADKCAACCDFYAENAAAMLAPERIVTEATRSYVLFQPLGVILAVMPWNFPFWQVLRAAVPALMAGNTMLLKHASNIPGCALAIAELFREAGLPSGAFRTLLIGSGRVAGLVADPLIRAITLTGSTPAGRSVASQAGQALKKTVLELGGSDPYVVLEDADLESAAVICASSRLINNGQSCIAAKRFIVVESVRARFEELFVGHLAKQVMGDPLVERTTLGPLARVALRDELHQQVTESVRLGARLLCGGAIPDGPGAFYPPTALADVKKGMPVYDQETFGPVAAIIGAEDEAQAIAVANDTVFGLGAAVFTRDLARGERIAAQLEAGCCFVNDFVRSDPRLPFGGVKESGYGRELSSFGLREFVNIKTVSLK